MCTCPSPGASRVSRGARAASRPAAPAFCLSLPLRNDRAIGCSVGSLEMVSIVAVLLSVPVLGAHAFIAASQRRMTASRQTTAVFSDSGGIEEIEFRIFPDGRVQEVVRGIKGKTCQEVTETINKQLGSVVDTAPTEEMFEEEVTIDQTITDNASDGGWEGSSSW